MSEVTLLTPPHNYAVVQLPERQFPGVVFQGDSLNSLIGEIEEAIAESDPQERAEAFGYIIAQLHSIRSGYEAALQTAGIKLPY